MECGCGSKPVFADGHLTLALGIGANMVFLAVVKLCCCATTIS